MQRRKTKNKDRILSVFNKQHVTSASEISALLPDVEQSVIYRNLQKFAEDGTIRTIHLGTGTTSYELASSVHDHFVCSGCNEVAAIHLSEDTLINKIPKGAQITPGKNIIQGLCNKCN